MFLENVARFITAKNEQSCHQAVEGDTLVTFGTLSEALRHLACHLEGEAVDKFLRSGSRSERVRQRRAVLQPEQRRSVFCWAISEIPWYNSRPDTMVLETADELQGAIQRRLLTRLIGESLIVKDDGERPCSGEVCEAL